MTIGVLEHTSEAEEKEVNKLTPNVTKVEKCVASLHILFTDAEYDI